jgi:hypothetical protein
MLLPVTECGKGVNLDLLPSELGAGIWSDASNVRFRNGFAQRRKGITSAWTTPTVTPYALFPFSTSTARFLMQFGTAKVFVDDGTTRTEITGAATLSGARDDRWSVSDFNGVAVFNNGVDTPYYWAGVAATPMAALTSWPAGQKADSLRVFKNYLFSLGVTKSGTKYPYRLEWSDAAEPGALPTSYAAAATNDAGEQDLTGIGALVDGASLGDVFIVYGEMGRFAVRYTGSSEVFSFQRLPGKDGLLNRGCVVETPKGHVFLTNGDIRIHAGGESVSLADGVVRDWLTQNMDSTFASRSFVCLNPQKTEVWVCFPSTNATACDTVLAWNWDAWDWQNQAKDGWSKFTAPNLTCGVAGLVSSSLSATTYSSLSSSVTYDTVTTLYSQNEASSNESRLILATTTPTIGLAETGSLDFGSAVSWYLEKTGIPLSANAELVRPIRNARLLLDAASGTLITVKLATTKNPDDEPTYSGSATHTQGTTHYANKFTTAGRFGCVRLEGADNQLSSLRTYQLDVADAGAKF